MRIISKKKLRDYYLHHTDAEIPLTEWYYKIGAIKAHNIYELRQHFNSVDPVHGYTIFNIAGNHHRLVTAIHYNTQICYVRRIWTHTEYSKRSNQKNLKRGDL